jgi:hypothetical protein
MDESIEKFHKPLNPTVKTVDYMKWENLQCDRTIASCGQHSPRIHSWVMGIKNRTKTVLTV